LLGITGWQPTKKKRLPPSVIRKDYGYAKERRKEEQKGEILPK